MKKMASLEQAPTMFSTLTFPDEYFEGLAPDEIASASSKAMKRFKYRLKRHHADVYGLWRREWVPRKSGTRTGVLTPHFHAITGSKLGLPLVKQLHIQELWVDALKLQEPGVKAKAYQVNMNYRGPGQKGNAFEIMSDRKHAQRYISKYMAKIDETEFEGSIGRNWGVIGDLPIAEGIEIEMSPGYANDLKRFIRRYIRITGKTKNPRAVKRFRKKYAEKETNSFVFIEASTIIRLMDYIYENHVPF